MVDPFAAYTPDVTQIDENISSVNIPSTPIIVADATFNAQIFVVGVGVSAPLFGATVVTIQTKPLGEPVWSDAQYVDFQTILSGANPPQQSLVLRFGTPCAVRCIAKTFVEAVRVRLSV